MGTTALILCLSAVVNGGSLSMRLAALNSENTDTSVASTSRLQSRAGLFNEPPLKPQRNRAILYPVTGMVEETIYSNDNNVNSEDDLITEEVRYVSDLAQSGNSVASQPYQTSDSLETSYNPYEMVPKEFHEFLDIPIHKYKNGTEIRSYEKYRAPLVSGGYANTQVQGYGNNRRVQSTNRKVTQRPLSYRPQFTAAFNNNRRVDIAIPTTTPTTTTTPIPTTTTTKSTTTATTTSSTTTSTTQTTVSTSKAIITTTAPPGLNAGVSYDGIAGFAWSKQETTTKKQMFPSSTTPATEIITPGEMLSERFETLGGQQSFVPVEPTAQRPTLFQTLESEGWSSKLYKPSVPRPHNRTRPSLYESLAIGKRPDKKRNNFVFPSDRLQSATTKQPFFEFTTKKTQVALQENAGAPSAIFPNPFETTKYPFIRYTENRDIPRETTLLTEPTRKPHRTTKLPNSNEFEKEINTSTESFGIFGDFPDFESQFSEIEKNKGERFQPFGESKWSHEQNTIRPPQNVAPEANNGFVPPQESEQLFPLTGDSHDNADPLPVRPHPFVAHAPPGHGNENLHSRPLQHGENLQSIDSNNHLAFSTDLGLKPPKIPSLTSAVQQINIDAPESSPNRGNKYRPGNVLHEKQQGHFNRPYGNPYLGQLRPPISNNPLHRPPPIRRQPTTESPGYFESFLSWFRPDNDKTAISNRPPPRFPPPSHMLSPHAADGFWNQPNRKVQPFNSIRGRNPLTSAISADSEPKPDEELPANANDITLTKVLEARVDGSGDDKKPNVLPQFRPNAQSNRFLEPVKLSNTLTSQNTIQRRQGADDREVSGGGASVSTLQMMHGALSKPHVPQMMHPQVRNAESGKFQRADRFSRRPGRPRPLLVRSNADQKRVPTADDIAIMRARRTSLSSFTPMSPPLSPPKEIPVPAFIPDSKSSSPTEGNPEENDSIDKLYADEHAQQISSQIASHGSSVVGPPEKIESATSSDTDHVTDTYSAEKIEDAHMMETKDAGMVNNDGTRSSEDDENEQLEAEQLIGVAEPTEMTTDQSKHSLKHTGKMTIEQIHDAGNGHMSSESEIDSTGKKDNDAKFEDHTSQRITNGNTDASSMLIGVSAKSSFAVSDSGRPSVTLGSGSVIPVQLPLSYSESSVRTAPDFSESEILTGHTAESGGSSDINRASLSSKLVTDFRAPEVEEGFLPMTSFN